MSKRAVITESFRAILPAQAENFQGNDHLRTGIGVCQRVYGKNRGKVCPIIGALRFIVLRETGQIYLPLKAAAFIDRTDRWCYSGITEFVVNY